MIYSYMCFKKKLSFVFLVILASQLACPGVKAMDPPVVEQQNSLTRQSLMEGLSKVKGYIEAAQSRNSDAQDALMDLFYQGRHIDFICKEIQSDFHEWDNILSRCCEKDDYAYFAISNFDTLDKNFQSSFLQICEGIKTRGEDPKTLFSRALLYFCGTEDPKTLCNRGFLYLYGRGVAVDTAKALALFESAAALGHAPSQFKLGILYKGWVQGTHEVESNPDLADAYMQQAADQEYAPAQYSYSSICDSSKRYDYLRPAVEAGDIRAQFDLGEFYGTKGDQENALLYYQLAADQGDSVAKHRMRFTDDFLTLSEDVFCQILSSEPYFKHYANLAPYLLVSKYWKNSIGIWISQIGVKNLDTGKHKIRYPREKSLTLNPPGLPNFYWYNDVDYREFDNDSIGELKGRMQIVPPLATERFTWSLGPNKTLNPPEVSSLFQSIENSFEGEDLKCFVLSNIPCQDDSGSLPQILLKCRVLQQLKLLHTGIVPENMKKIINNLSQTLKLLNLVGNNFGDEECNALRQKLPILQNLQLLSLGGNVGRHQYISFYGRLSASYGDSASLLLDPIKSYRGGKERRKQIIPSQKPSISPSVLEKLTEALNARKTIEYIIFT